MSCGLDTSSMLKAGSAICFLPRHIALGTLTTLSRGIQTDFNLHPDRSGVILSTIHQIASGDFLQRYQRPMCANYPWSILEVCAVSHGPDICQHGLRLRHVELHLHSAA